jgi:hypothetical protein
MKPSWPARQAAVVAGNAADAIIKESKQTQYQKCPAAPKVPSVSFWENLDHGAAFIAFTSMPS